MAATRSRPAGLGGGQQPGLDPVRLPQGCRGPSRNGSGWAECSALRRHWVPAAVQGRGDQKAECGSIPAFRSHSASSAVPAPGTAMFLGALRSGESVLSEVGGLKMVATLTAELDGDRRLGLSRPAGGRPAVEMMSVTGVGTVMLRRPGQRSVWYVCSTRPVPTGADTTRARQPPSPGCEERILARTAWCHITAGDGRRCMAWNINGLC